MKTVTVGVVADPGLSTKVAGSLADSLATRFADAVCREIGWNVTMCSRALPVNGDGNIEVRRHADELRCSLACDVVVCLTESTTRLGKTLIVSEVDVRDKTALISLPALGPVRLRRHVARSIVHAVGAMTIADAVRSPAQLFGPTRQEITDGADGRHAFVELTRVHGRLRLLLGMVRVNRPWRLLPSLSGAIAASVAAAAFGVFYSSIWMMADAMSALRLTAVSIVAVVAMMLWLMLYNGLWERPRDLDQRKNAVLYNTATVLTLIVGVTSMYVALFVVVVSGAMIIIPPAHLESTLGHDTSWRDYAQLAWLASSLGTFAGALGSSFESDHAVRNATFGKREQERHARAALSDPSDRPTAP
ncbi:hypothetical protein MMAG44476_01245 [Mycolicibacterium mageritense DSM 44476 = CIP 104973]|uniref:hypothetical protein n=1 Tax=Mycolicibacterium TaxID=1866885 RepID=UPI000431BC53|nr:hypothetical protein [Mycolicibacterium mageritense]MBN3452916.1 hypothetical protein [Mycobacterium sp. DSM 3803]MCC9184701.1 hypothetical protein [Mycolicibacterium mageritense]CDO20092.1 hypothetical protein BN978_00544 [Mycolicibacterium mageritense DSM 44476 = CIP 104973]